MTARAPASSQRACAEAGYAVVRPAMAAEAGKLPVVVPTGEGGKNVRLVTKRGAIILVTISFTIMALAIAKFPGEASPLI